MANLQFKKGKYPIVIQEYYDVNQLTVVEVQGYVDENHKFGINSSKAVEKAYGGKPSATGWKIVDLYSGLVCSPCLKTKKKCIEWINEYLEDENYLMIFEKRKKMRDKYHEMLTAFEN